MLHLVRLQPPKALEKLHLQLNRLVVGLVYGVEKSKLTFDKLNSNTDKLNLVH